MVWKLGTMLFQGGDYYLLLNIPPSALDEEIRLSFRRLALRFHSDKTNGYELNNTNDTTSIINFFVF